MSYNLFTCTDRNKDVLVTAYSWKLLKPYVHHTCSLRHMYTTQGNVQGIPTPHMLLKAYVHQIVIHNTRLTVFSHALTEIRMCFSRHTVGSSLRHMYTKLWSLWHMYTKAYVHHTCSFRHMYICTPNCDPQHMSYSLSHALTHVRLPHNHTYTHTHTITHTLLLWHNFTPHLHAPRWGCSVLSTLEPQAWRWSGKMTCRFVPYTSLPCCLLVPSC
jgi:hypothetical protein